MTTEQQQQQKRRTGTSKGTCRVKPQQTGCVFTATHTIIIVTICRHCAWPYTRWKQTQFESTAISHAGKCSSKHQRQSTFVVGNMSNRRQWSSSMVIISCQNKLNFNNSKNKTNRRMNAELESTGVWMWNQNQLVYECGTRINWCIWDGGLAQCLEH